MTRYDDDDDDFQPRKNTRTESVDSDDDDDVRPASKSRRDDDDETPKRTIKRGWGAAEQVKSSDSAFAQRLKISEDEILIKFLEEDPYASYRQHWLERSGQKSFTCIADIDDRGCPLCDNGNRPAARFAFNVAAYIDDEWQVKSYEVGSRVIDQLKNFHRDERQGPLPKHYWAVRRTGKGTTSATNHQMVKERDLFDEWKVEPISAEEMKHLMRSAYSEDIIPVPKRKDLLAIASEDE